LLAKKRLAEAEQKLSNVHRWSGRVDEEIFTYQAVASGMQQALTVDIPTALAKLDAMLASLEAYAPSAAPQAQTSTAAGGQTPMEEAAMQEAEEEDDAEPKG